MRRVLAVSALAHVIVFALAMRVEVARPPAPVIPTVEKEEATIDLAEEPTAAPSATATAVPMDLQVAPASFYNVGSAAEPAPVTSAPPAPSAEPAPVASNGTWVVFGPSLGLSSSREVNPFLGRGALPNGAGAGAGAAPSGDPMFIPENKRAEQAVKDALRARDHAVGLGPEGPVLTALEGAAHAGFAPERGTATFLAVINEHGIVIDLKLVSSTTTDKAGERGWEDVRQRAVKTLASAKIEMRGVKRAELQIAVESKVLLPSGNTPGGGPVQPKAEKSVTKVETNAPGSPGGSDVVQTATVATFDVTDIGAKPTRVVHAKLVSIKTL